MYRMPEALPHSGDPAVQYLMDVVEQYVRSVFLDAPELLRSKCTGGVLLPQIIKGSKENQLILASERLLQAGNCLLLVLRRRHSLAIGLTVMRPSRLANERLFAAGRFGDLVGLVFDVLAGFIRGVVVVEEGMAVGSTVIRRLAELGVLDHD